MPLETAEENTKAEHMLKPDVEEADFLPDGEVLARGIMLQVEMLGDDYAPAPAHAAEAADEPVADAAPGSRSSSSSSSSSAGSSSSD